MIHDELINQLALSLEIIPGKDAAAIKKQVADKLNEWIEKDFQKLISVLYRMDISEPKLRLLLQNNPGTDAGMLIAELMIERQAEKIKSRQLYRKRDNDIDETEKW